MEVLHGQHFGKTSLPPPWKGLGEAPDRTLDPSECWHLHPGLREGSTVSFVILPSWLWNSQK